MKNSKIEILNNITIAKTFHLTLLSSVAIGLPLIFHNQLVTGPIVNAVLILILFLVDVRSAIFVGLVPSIMALGSGLLPAILAPAVPFIMVSNAVLLVVMDLVYRVVPKENLKYVVSLTVGSFAKFLFLILSVSTVAKLLINQNLAMKAASLMSWPQFATAMLGGLIAGAVLRIFKRI